MTRISIDNGNHFFTAEDIDMIWEEIESRNLYNAIVNVMDDETREQVASDFEGETEKDFLRQYLDTAESDIVIG